MTHQKILIINGHPVEGSLNHSLSMAYKDGAAESGAEVKIIHLADLKFNPNLAGGYSRRTELEPDLLLAWQDILWADHLVWVHPVWWGGMPAIMKGFIDRLFLPGMAFQYKPDSVWWDKLLTGRSAHIITTMDQPGWYYHLMYGRPSINALRKSILEFCGIRPVRVTTIGIVKKANEKQIKSWIDQIYQAGLKRR
jgi:putative NADPH-quinone reductase